MKNHIIPIVTITIFIVASLLIFSIDKGKSRYKHISRAENKMVEDSIRRSEREFIEVPFAHLSNCFLTAHLMDPYTYSEIEKFTYDKELNKTIVEMNLERRDLVVALFGMDEMPEKYGNKVNQLWFDTKIVTRKDTVDTVVLCPTYMFVNLVKACESDQQTH